MVFVLIRNSLQWFWERVEMKGCRGYINSLISRSSYFLFFLLSVVYLLGLPQVFLSLTEWLETSSSCHAEASFSSVLGFTSSCCCFSSSSSLSVLELVSPPVALPSQSFLLHPLLSPSFLLLSLPRPRFLFPSLSQRFLPFKFLPCLPPLSHNFLLHPPLATSSWSSFLELSFPFHSEDTKPLPSGLVTFASLMNRNFRTLSAGSLAKHFEAFTCLSSFLCVPCCLLPWCEFAFCAKTFWANGS